MAQKKKLSIDFGMAEYRQLVEYAKQQTISNSAVINRLISLFLGLPSEYASVLGEECLAMAQTERLKGSDSGLHGSQSENTIKHLINMAEFFGVKEDAEEIPGMKRIYLADGYIRFPEDWIVLDNVFGEAEDCLYAGVVESRNADKYNIPHFLFFSNVQYANDYTDDMEEKVYAACASACPEFKTWYNMQVDPIYDNDKQRGLPINIDEWRSSPRFGLFSLPVQGDPLYYDDPDDHYEPPYGAVIVPSAYDGD